MQRAVAAARSRFLETAAERLETLDRAGAALLEGNLKPGARELARREAHKLAGLLGTIGLAAGSRFAREMEEILTGGVSSGPAQAMRYSESRSCAPPGRGEAFHQRGPANGTGHR